MAENDQVESNQNQAVETPEGISIPKPLLNCDTIIIIAAAEIKPEITG